MAAIPSFEDTLLEIHQSHGLERPQSKYINQFVDFEMPMEKHQKMATELRDAIFAALEMDEKARHDAAGNMLEWAGFHQALELHTWTGNASQQQVVWHLLAYCYVPAFARRVAFWGLAGAQRQLPIDAGMPGGKFWFLPNWNQTTNTIELPVPQVIAWLIDLLGEQPLEQAMQGLERESNGEIVNSHALRTLQGWRLEGRLPKSVKMIDDLFHDDSRLELFGAYEPNPNLPGEQRYAEILKFVQRKGVDAEALADEIPMTLERLKSILDGSAPDDEKQEFVRLMALRYAAPSMPIIRQRLRVARLTQDGYVRLLKSLCGDEVDAGCTDPDKNKLLQLFALFQNIYNLTIAAWKAADSVEEQDAWFEARLAPWDKADLLLSIVPSRRETAYLELSERLTRKFMAMEPTSPLDDLVSLGEGDAGAVIKRRLLSLKQEAEEDLRLVTLIDRVRRSSPWRALQAEASYWVVSQFAQVKGWSVDVRAMATKRLRELATTPGQTAGVIMLELGFLLNDESRQRPKDIQQRVQLLLDEAQACPGYDEWKAPLLRLRAKHRLMQNDFEGACADLKAALKACSERGFGAVRGESARDGLATEIAVNGFTPQSQEGYYRDMIRYGMFPDGAASIEDTAVWCDEFFWNDLYQPYLGFERRERLTTQVFKTVLAKTFGLIETADWDGLRLWMKQHAKQLRKANFKDARCDSVLLLWLKMLNTFEATLPVDVATMPLDMIREFEKVERHIQNRRQAVRLLLEAWPEQAHIADFKGQTPLMLVTDNGDAELTKLLAPLSNVDAQDYRGRTALHSAASGRSPDCVAIILELNPDIAKATADEGNTALHTAVRFGQPECVGLILEAYPGLALQVNAAGQGPLEIAQDIRGNLSAWQDFMRKQNRLTGLKKDFEAIVDLLTA